MFRKPRSLLREVSSDNDARIAVPNCQQSTVQLRAHPIAPTNAIAMLPEAILSWLHDGMDRAPLTRFSSFSPALVAFESAIIERLFPHRDQRTEVVRLRLHSHATAISARVVAEHTGVPQETAYACGWLHDLGIASCLQGLDALDVDFASELPDPLWMSIKSSFPSHAVALASRWRMPSAIRHCIREHVGLDTTMNPGKVACVTFVAEHIATTQGCGFRDEQPASGLRKCLSLLGLTEHDLLPLSRRTERQYGRVELEWQSLRFR